MKPLVMVTLLAAAVLGGGGGAQRAVAAELGVGAAPGRVQPPAPWPGGAAPALAQFRVTWGSRATGGAPTIGGWVHNASAFRVSGVRLRVEGLDASQRPVGETFAYAEGDILPGGHTYFVATALPNATTYRVHVVSFEIISHGD